jgi:hypothetical protein
MKTTNTNLRLSTEIMERFKEVIREEGYRLGKGVENALSEYIKKREKKHGDKK